MDAAAAGEPDRPSAGGLADGIGLDASPTPATTTAADWHLIDGTYDRLGQLDGLRTPTLVVGGRQDVLTPPRYATYLAGHLPDAELVLLDDADHWLPFVSPERVGPHVQRFLDRLGNDGARPSSA